MRKYDFEFCMKHNCNGCKRGGSCSDFEKKNRHSDKRIEKKRKRYKNFKNVLFEN